MLFRIHNFFYINSNSCLKFYSTKQASKKIVKYTSTINLPKTDFPSRQSPPKRKEIEQKLTEDCHSELYAYQRDHNNHPEFVLHDGPPYANGDLHMGHAVNKILKDITLRYQVGNDVKVHYIPGWDCHGLPIELKAMSGRVNVDPLEIRRKSREFASNTITKQKQEFRSWGVMADWNNVENIYRTFDKKFIENQLNIFLKLYKKNFIYRDLKPVYWSPSSRTALAEAELEYDPNFVSPSIILRLKLLNVPQNIQMENISMNSSSSLYALIWTTTPWTLPSNQAVCFNAKLTYCWIRLTNDDENNLYMIASSLVEEFEKLTGKNVVKLNEFSGENLNNITYQHPINNTEELPFLSATHVQENKGTGLVHTSPAHGPDDYLVSLVYKIPIKCYVDETGKYIDSAQDFLKGKFILNEGNSSVIKYLKENIIHDDKITHSYPIDWRTKKPVIIRASHQWFIDTDKLKQKAIEEISNVKIFPRGQSDANKKMLISQLEKRPYWCISRQRSWGVPIPVFYNKNKTNSEHIIMNEKLIKHICSLLEKEKNMDFWWEKSVEELIPKILLDEMNLNVNDIEKGKDIFDIWFDSGISWYNVLNNNKVADLYLEGFDQFTGWFQSSLLTSIAYRNCAPYKSIFVHGFAVDDKGRKMSKSLGNVILPKDIIKKYGTDVLRWWVASHGTQHTSITISENLLKNSAESLIKIRSILRYLNGIIGEKNEFSPENPILNEDQLTCLDKYFLNELWEFDHRIQKSYETYDYNRVTQSIQNFIANQISSIYFHLIKDRLYCGDNNEYKIIQKIFINAYEILCKSLWPIVPFLIEESWSYYAKEPFYKSKINSRDIWRNSNSIQPITLALELRHKLNQKLNDINTWILNIEIKCNEENLKILKKLHPLMEKSIKNSELCEILQVSSVKLSTENSDDSDVNILSMSKRLCARCRRFSINDGDIDDEICDRCEQVLLTKNIVSNAN